MSDKNDKKPTLSEGFQLAPIFFVLFILGILIFLLFSQFSESSITEITYSDFIENVKNDKVSSVVIVGGEYILGTYSRSGGTFGEFKTFIPYNDSSLMELLSTYNVAVKGKPVEKSWLSYLIDFLPLILMLLLFIMMYRQTTMQNMRGMQFGKSRARKYSGSKHILFKDVAGQEEAKRELAEIVDFLKEPIKFVDMGAKIPKGVLLVGSPGTGKTLLARAVAGEAGVNFLHISGSDFVEMFVGVGASRVRDLFEEGCRSAPCIIFIDEIDGVGRARGAGFGGGHDEREQTLNQLLVEMDGFEAKNGVIVLAATNRPDVLDPALLRPGRFDRQVVVSLPDIKEREAILRVHAEKIQLDKEVDLHKIARGTSGMSGADLANLVNEAALFAARKSKKTVQSVDFEEARDKILMGVARKSLVLPEKERTMTAYHEAGHTLPYYYLQNVSPLHKVTIIPRGRALGLTIGLPEKDSYSHTKSMLRDQLVILFGGYASEMLVYGETTTGTQNDIQRATDLAHRMVCEWGMSSKIDAVCYGNEEEPIFMGKEIARHKDYSEYTAHQIDTAVREILLEAKDCATQILSAHRNELDLLAKTLLEKETLCDEEIRTLLGFEPLQIAEDA